MAEVHAQWRHRHSISRLKAILSLIPHVESKTEFSFIIFGIICIQSVTNFRSAIIVYKIPVEAYPV
jgi:hypothetical protein